MSEAEEKNNVSHLVINIGAVLYDDTISEHYKEKLKVTNVIGITDDQ